MRESGDSGVPGPPGPPGPASFRSTRIAFVAADLPLLVDTVAVGETLIGTQLEITSAFDGVAALNVDGTIDSIISVTAPNAVALFTVLNPFSYFSEGDIKVTSTSVSAIGAGTIILNIAM